MNIDNNLQFIIEKISQLRTAVMYSMSNELVKLPNDIVSYVNIDDEGQLCFISHLPPQLLSECEKEFPARLHFFRKGFDFHVQVSGKATIITDISNNDSKVVFIKMTMKNIEYTEPNSPREKTRIQVMAERSYKWMLRHIGFPHTQASVLNKLHQPH